MPGNAMFGFKHGRLGSAGTRTLIQRAIASLRARGSDAHLWLPGGDVKTYGPELVVNGDFSNGTTGWTTIQAGWTVAAGVASVTSSVAGSTCIRQGLTVAGKSYRITATITTITSGIVYLIAGNAWSSGITQSGTYSYTVTANDSTGFGVYAQSTTAVASFDNISVREITSITSAITNGLTTGNYLESTGNSLATVDNPCGLVLDALGTVGANLVPSTIPSITGVGWTTNGTSITATSATASGTFTLSASTSAAKSYEVTFTASALSGATSYMVFSGGVAAVTKRINTAKPYSFVVPGHGNATFEIAPYEGTAFSVTISNISVREVTGIHLTQSTTANKGLLKQDAGSRYYWLFDATDLLTGTFPAGYESVTVIDAKSTGQVTTSAANVVGSYSIGPSYSSYGRIIIKGSITASELALYQGFANRLAGL